MICRIFHKAGEKKNGILQGQSYFFEACSSPSGSLPPLLETQTTLLECQSQNPNSIEALQNSFVYHQQESDLKSLINPVVSQSHSHDLFPMNGFQSSFSHNPTTIISTNTSNTTNKHMMMNTDNTPSQSMLFKSLLSHQDFTLKEQTTIPRQCKTEANFSHFQLPDANNSNFSWMEKIHPNPYQNPLFFEMDCNLSGLTTQSATIAGSSANETSTSVAFNRTSFQVMLDTPFRLPGESWALDA